MIAEQTHKLAACTSPVILRNEVYDPNGVFLGFDSYKTAGEFIQSFVDKSKRTFHEVIRGERYFMMDIDIKTDDKPDNDYVINEVIRTLEQVFNDKFDRKITAKRNIIILEAHGCGKMSYHIVVVGFHFAGHEEVKQVYEYVKREISPDLLPFLDDVYKTVQNFRCAGCTKDGQKRPFIPSIAGKCLTKSNAFIGNVGMSECISVQLPEKKPRITSAAAENVDIEEVKALLNVITTYYNNNPVKFSYYDRLPLITAIQNSTDNAELAEEFIKSIRPEKVHEVYEKWGGLTDETKGVRTIYEKAYRCNPEATEAISKKKPEGVLNAGDLLRVLPVDISDVIDIKTATFTYDENIISVNGGEFMIHPITGVYRCNNDETTLIKTFTQEDRDYKPVNCDFLDMKYSAIYDVVTPYLSTGGILAIKSPLGSGKTELIKTLLRTKFKKSNVLCITPRISLAQDLHGKLNKGAEEVAQFEIYTDKDLKISEQTRIIIQFDSLKKLLDNNERHKKYEVVIIDEFISLLHHMISDNLRLKAAELYSFLRKLVKEAKYTFVMDGLLSIEAIDILKDFDKPITKLYNEYKRPDPIIINFEKSRNVMFDSIRADISKGHKIVIVTSSIKFIDNIKMNLPDNVKYERQEDDTKDTKYCQIFHGKSGKRDRKQLENVNETWSKPDILIYTSVVGCGVDFNEEYYDNQYVFIKGHTSLMPMWCQMIRRVRKIKSNRMTVNVSYVGSNNIKYYIEEMAKSPIGEDTDDKNVYISELEKVKRYYYTCRERSNFIGRPYFLQALRDQNYTIENVSGITTHKKPKSTHSFDLYNEILETKTELTFSELCTKSKAGEAETEDIYALTRLFIENKLRDDVEICRDDIKDCNNGEFVNATTRLNIMYRSGLSTLQEVINLHKSENYVYVKDEEQRNNIHKILLLLQAMGGSLPIKDIDGEYSTPEVVTDFEKLRTFFVKHPAATLYNAILHKRYRGNIQDAKDWGYKELHIKTVNALLEYIGLKLGSVTKRLRWYEGGKQKEKAVHDKYIIQFYKKGVPRFIKN
jgi:hypothetical protein